MASKYGRKSKKFSIEDAFEEDGEDAVRLYGSTNKSTYNNLNSHDRHAKSKLVTDNNATIDNVPLTVIKNHTGLFKEERSGFLPVPTNSDTASRDSDSLIPGGSNEYYPAESGEPCWLCHPRVRESWRVVLGAFILFFLGTVLLTTGIVIESVPIASMSSLAFFIAGVICFIPGLYHVVFILLAALHCGGYNFYNLSFLD